MKNATETMVKLVVDGQAVEASPDRTILQVARDMGRPEIPTLCYLEGLEPFGSCFLCVVEVEGIGRLLPACATRVTPGMKVTTRSPRIERARRTALELFLSNHYADCVGTCHTACPAGIDVQGYISLIHLGRPAEAVALIREKNPLPMICGRVCVRKCEVVCRRNDVDSSVGINNLKRYVADIESAYELRPEVQPDTGRRIAVVGSGPAGLTAAYYLRLAGHHPTILETLPHPGGMLRYGIPEYRLPKEILDREIGFICDLGVELQTEQTLGGDSSLAELQEEYDAVFLAVGAQKAKPMRVEGETAPGVVGGIDFLRDVHLEGIPSMPGTVLVVGGGNTAIDAARTALRCGADRVRVVYRRTEAEMPADDVEILAAKEEGVEFAFLAAPSSVITGTDRVTALRVQQMELGEPDDSGRRRPVPIPDAVEDVPCDWVLSAIGQDVDLECLGDACYLPEDKPEGEPTIERTRWNTIVVSEDTFETNLPNVFAGGDAVSGPAAVIDAVAMGQHAARAIDAFLRTGKPEPRPKPFFMSKDLLGGVVEEEIQAQQKQPRECQRELDPSERTRCWDEVELTLDDEQAARETERCLECGCESLLWCDLRRYAGEYGVEIERFKGETQRYKVDRRHPLIELDQNKCILCGKCVRICGEVLDIAAFGFVNRGFRTMISPALGKPLQETECITCGSCIDVCPTGAISARMPFGRIACWEPEVQTTTCSFCGLGCSVDYRIYAPGLYDLTGRDRGELLCVRGRWGHTFLSDPERLVRPLIGSQGSQEESTWEQALEAAGAGLKQVMEEHGPDAVAVLGSPRMNLEEQYALARLAREAIGTDRIGSFSEIIRGNQDTEQLAVMGQAGSNADLEDLQSADLILVVGADPDETSPVLAMRIRQAAKRGAKLVVLHSQETRLARRAEIHLDPAQGTVNLLLAALARTVIDRGREDRAFIETRTSGWTEFRQELMEHDPRELARRAGVVGRRIEAVADLLGDPDRSVVTVFGSDSALERAPGGMTALLDLLLLSGKLTGPGNGLILARRTANAQGLREAGLVQDQEDPLEAMRDGRVKALLILGENPLIDSQSEDEFQPLELLVAGDLFATETTRRADVVLPLSAPGESEGLVVSMDRRARGIRCLSQPPAGRTTLEVIQGLAQALGGLSISADPAELRVELAGRSELTNPESWRELPEESRGWLPQADQAGEGFSTQDGRARFGEIPIAAGIYRPIEVPYGVTEQRLVAWLKEKGLRP